MSLLRLTLRNLASKPERFWPMAAGVFLLALSVLHSLGGMRALQQLRLSSLQDMAAHQAQIVVIPRYARSTGLRQSFQTLTSLMEEIKRVQGVSRVDQLAQFLSADIGGRLIHIVAAIPDPYDEDQSSVAPKLGQPSFGGLTQPYAALLGSGLSDYPAEGTFDFMGFPLNSLGFREAAMTSADSTVYLSYETADDFLRHIDTAGLADTLEKSDEQSLIVTVAQGEDPLAVSNRILRDVKNVYLFDGHSFFADESKSLQAVDGSVVILQAVIPGGLMLGLAVLFSVSVLGRKRELSVLRAMGASASFVRSMLLMENGITGLLGGAGALLAYTLYHLAAGPDIGAHGLEMLAGLGAGVAGILTATWIPATLMSRRDPARFMKG